MRPLLYKNVFLCFLMIALLYPNIAFAETASQFLEKSVGKIISILQKPEWQTEEGKKDLYPLVKANVRAMFDFRAISSQIIGTKWNAFTPEEQEQFINVLSSMLEYTYSSSFVNYKGQTLHIETERTNSSGTQAEVKTYMQNPDGTKTLMMYRLLRDGDSWKVYNVIVENINLIVSYKTQLQEMLVNNTPAEIIKKMEAQSQSLSSKENIKK